MTESHLQRRPNTDRDIDISDVVTDCLLIGGARNTNRFVGLGRLLRVRRFRSGGAARQGFGGKYGWVARLYFFRTGSRLIRINYVPVSILRPVNVGSRGGGIRHSDYD